MKKYVTTFRYDAAGSRIEKKTVKAGVTTITRYVHDASGNVMGVYEGATGTTLTEQSIYGSSRLGMYRTGRLKGMRKLGTKSYELSNHLGNVLTVITDNINMTADSTWATVVSANDYYAFGSSMVGRNFNDNTYRYGFNGKEKDEKGELGDTHYDYGFRIYNPRLGRFLSVDPLTKEYPWYTPYQFAGNNPIWAIDIDGLEEGVVTMYSVNPNGQAKIVLQTSYATMGDWKGKKEFEQFNIINFKGEVQNMYLDYNPITKKWEGGYARCKMLQDKVKRIMPEKNNESMLTILNQGLFVNPDERTIAMKTTMKNYFAALSLVFAAPEILAGEAGALTYVSTASDVDQLTGASDNISNTTVKTVVKMIEAIAGIASLKGNIVKASTVVTDLNQVEGAIETTTAAAGSIGDTDDVIESLKDPKKKD